MLRFGNGSPAERGQTSVEIMSVAIVMTALLLLVLFTTFSRNAETQETLAFNENSIQCREMASVIARLYNNRGEVRESLFLDHDANALRVEGKPGSISVGSASCFYIGNLQIGAVSDVNGISFSGGWWCFEKNDGETLAGVGQCG